MTDHQTVVRVADLRRACTLLLERVERQHGARVYLGQADLYWEVDLAAAFASTDRPEEHLDCGQVADDLAELAGVLARPGDEVVLWRDLAHLVALLRCLAYLDHPGRCS